MRDAAGVADWCSGTSDRDMWVSTPQSRARATEWEATLCVGSLCPWFHAPPTGNDQATGDEKLKYRVAQPFGQHVSEP